MWTTGAYSALPDAQRHTRQLTVCVCVGVCARTPTHWLEGRRAKEGEDVHSMNHWQTQAGEPSNNLNAFIQQILPKYLWCTKHREPLQGCRGVPHRPSGSCLSLASPSPPPLIDLLCTDARRLRHCLSSLYPQCLAYRRCLICAYQNT